MEGRDLEDPEFEAIWGYTWVTGQFGLYLENVPQNKMERGTSVHWGLHNRRFWKLQNLLKCQLFCYYVWNAKEVKYQRKRGSIHHSLETEVQYMIKYVTRKQVIIVVHYTNSAWFLQTSVNTNLPWKDGICWELRKCFPWKLQTSVGKILVLWM